VTLAKPSEPNGFYRTKANGKITLDGVAVSPDNVSLGVK
jgi:hypothetical protein